MAARGSTAKEAVIAKMKEAFGSDFVGVDGSKIYVWANDGGETVQIALAMTCPKVEFGGSSVPTETKPADFNWANEPMEVSKEEEDNIRKMMKELGL